MKSIVFLALVAALAALSACTAPPEASRETFTKAMQTYLAQRGDLCLAKDRWPIDVTQHEVDIGARNALQMPVLERLGLVSSRVATIDIDDGGIRHRMDVRRYALTDAGRRHVVTRGPANAASAQAGQSDFCAARLSLDKVVDWKLGRQAEEAAPVATVMYTYRVEAASWTSDPDIQKVFPVVAGVIRGAGSAQLQETFVSTDKGWIAIDLRGR
jgi:hypothetical protein